MDWASASDKGGSQAGAVSISEFRAHLAEMVGRAERGEEIVILRGREPVAKLAPLRKPLQRKLGSLKDMLSEEGLARLSNAVAAPLSAEDQAAQEGGGTDPLGVARR